MIAYLAETKLIDFNHMDLVDFFEKNSHLNQSKTANVVQLYNAIRDGWYYDPYQFSITENGLTASKIFNDETGHCISKAILFVAACRWLKVPSRLCFAKVKNHIATEQLEKTLGTNELVPHGYVEVFLNEKWVKATPAFNRTLCEKLGVATLDFDGLNDSVFQEYDKAGAEFMEYLEDYGHYEDVPIDFILNIMKAHYPSAFLDKKLG